MGLREDEKIMTVFRNADDHLVETFSVMISGSTDRIPEVIEGNQVPYVSFDK